MKTKLRWVIVGTLGFLAVLAVVAAVLLPRLIDPESYRGLLRSNLERQLGRQVEFGAMELSLWPVLGLRLDDLVIGRTATERFDKPVVAESLRVGARLLPLLRGRLEVTSLIIEGPVLTLYRRGDGTWEPALAAADSRTAGGDDQAVKPLAPPNTTAEAAPLVIEQLRMTRGRVVLRRDESGGLRETTLEDVTLDLAGMGVDGPIAYDLSASFGASATFRGNGNLHPGDATQGRPLKLSARLEVEDVDPSTLREWLAALVPTQRFPEQLLAERLFSSSATIEYTASRPARLAISDVVVKQLGLRFVRSASGVWNNPFASDSAPKTQGDDDPAAMAIQLSNLTIEDASIRIEDHAVTDAARVMTNASAARGPSILNLNALRLSLDRLPTDAPAALALEAQIGSGTGGKLEVRGMLGPLADDPAAMPLDLSLKLGAVAFDDLRSFLPTAEDLDVSKATAAADLRLSGAITRKLDVRGQVSLSNATASFVTPHGGVRKLPFDLIARGGVVVSNSAARIELSNLELELPRADANRKLVLRGSVDASSEPPRIDLELLPTKVVADDLAVLATLFVSDASLSFGSPNPVELELRARGPFGRESLPDLEGRATLSDFTFRVAGMAQPMEKVGANVTFTGRRITLDGLEGVIGKSSVTASRVVVTDFEAPRIQLDLTSRNADFWELFSFVESEETAPGATPTSVTESDPLDRLTIEGTLRIDRGSLQTLAFEKLTTDMNYRGGVVTLAPLEMSLYGGTFSGKLVQDLNKGVLTISGNGTGIDANGFLAQNADLGGLISGLASTEQNLQVRAVDPANVLAGVSGGGPLQITDGRLAKLDVLDSLSKVTGIFGERSLQRLTKQLATAGTSFRRAETRLRLEAGTLNFDDLVIEMAELTLAGRASIDSATGKLKGRFEVAISPELSAAMREEQSRAARLFWDPRTQRVSFGFGVEGPATAPAVSVDWDRALRGAAERELGSRLRGLLEKKLGIAPEAQTGVSPSSGATTEAVGTATEPGADDPLLEALGLVVDITSSRWTGPVLLRDLSLAGNVGGPGIERVSLTVIDARGAEVQTIDRLRSVDDQLGSIGDRDAEVKLSWRVEIDGKRLLAARFPVKITVTVYDRHGRSASASREVKR